MGVNESKANMNQKYSFQSTTLDAHPRREAIRAILRAALDGAEPWQCVTSAISVVADILQIGGQVFRLSEVGKIKVVAFGKAAPAMAAGVWDVLGERIDEGIVISKFAAERELPGFEYITGGHPVPNENSLKAAARVFEVVSNLSANDLVIYLISGGGSALITSPIAGINLTDFQALTGMLLGCGAKIDEINTLRRVLDEVKGGGLAKVASPAQQVSLILSDVIGSPLEGIASGPTVKNPTGLAEARQVIEKYEFKAKLPKSIVDALKRNLEPEDAVYGEALVIGSNQISAEVARQKAEQEGFHASIITTSLQGEASRVGAVFATTSRATVLAMPERPLCLIAGGETTVTLGDKPGMGGRNLETALAAVEFLSGAEELLLVTLATDGDDGPSGAAGAVVSGATATRAKALGIDPETHLGRHSSLDFFNALGDSLITGPTGTNVNDLIFLFAF